MYMYNVCVSAAVSEETLPSPDQIAPPGSVMGSVRMSSQPSSVPSSYYGSQRLYHSYWRHPGQPPMLHQHHYYNYHHIPHTPRHSDFYVNIDSYRHD